MNYENRMGTLPCLQRQDEAAKLELFFACVFLKKMI